jgi:hypothetical protein
VSVELVKGEVKGRGRWSDDVAKINEKITASVSQQFSLAFTEAIVNFVIRQKNILRPVSIPPHLPSPSPLSLP